MNIFERDFTFTASARIQNAKKIQSGFSVMLMLLLLVCVFFKNVETIQTIKIDTTLTEALLVVTRKNWKK